MYGRGENVRKSLSGAQPPLPIADCRGLRGFAPLPDRMTMAMAIVGSHTKLRWAALAAVCVGLPFVLLSASCSRDSEEPTEQAADSYGVIDRESVELLPDDAAVINAAMLAFFDNSVWDPYPWMDGDFLLLRLELDSETRPDFEPSLDDAIKSYEGYGDKVEILAKLRNMKDSIRREGPGFDPGSVKALEDMELDERIVLGEIEGNLLTFGSEIESNGFVRKHGTMRADGRLYPPAYSHDGRYACVKMTWVPWSIHSADLFFLLERTKDGWKIVDVRQEIYH